MIGNTKFWRILEIIKYHSNNIIFVMQFTLLIGTIPITHILKSNVITCV